MPPVHAPAAPAPRPTATPEAGGTIVGAAETALKSGTGRFEISAWDRLLKEGTREGLVDYDFMRNNRARLDAYLQMIAEARVDRLSPGHLEAFLINAYNAYVIATVLDRPGKQSVRDIEGFWRRMTHPVGGFEVTLDTIEHDVLRKLFRDPRLHFALNCGAMSCPLMPPWGMNGDRVDAQLEERARAFLSDSRNVRIEGDALLLVRFFDWYTADFVSEDWRGHAPSIPEYVARYASPEVAAFIKKKGAAIPIQYMDYDWQLNAAPFIPPVVQPAPSATPPATPTATPTATPSGR